MCTPAEWFYNEFNNIFAKDTFYEEASLLYTNSTKFTPFITRKINKIIKSGNYIPINEYYRIDAIGYTNRSETLSKSESLNPHLWDLEIAVEHENNHKDWLDEVIKLAHIYCPLRVVIGYVPWDQREFGDVERLSYAASVLKKLKCKDNLRHGEFLVILGNSNTTKKDDFFKYKAYILNHETLEFENFVIAK